MTSKSILLLVGLVATGCARSQLEGPGERTEFAGRFAYCMTDGQSEAVVVPALRRLMRFGPVGGPNVLYVNPIALDALPETDSAAWANYGGDKVWFWPQSDWRWPPPGDRAGDGGHGVHFACPTAIMARSEPVPPYGAAIHRAFEMKDGRLTIASTFGPGHDSATPPKLDGVAVWAITQLPRPERLFVRLTPGAEPRSVVVTGDEPLPVVGTLAGGRVVEVGVGPLDDVGRKGFFDADRLAAWDGGRLVVVTHAGPADGPYRPGERAQVFASPRSESASMGGASPYVELEFTGPRAGVGKVPPALVTTIEVHEGVTNAERAARIVAGG